MNRDVKKPGLSDTSQSVTEDRTAVRHTPAYMSGTRMTWVAFTVVLVASGCATPTPRKQPSPSQAEAPQPGRVAEAPHANEESVRPGVNDKYFRDGALPRYTAIFEAERREVVEHRDAIVVAIGLRQGMAVADVGAGTGLFTNAIAEAVGPKGQVFAVDIVPEFLARVDERAKAANLTHVTTVLGEERTTGLPASSVDLVFMCDTYHHLEYPRSYLRSVYESLRPDGVLILIDLERIEGTSPSSTLEHVRAGKETVIAEVTGVGFVLDNEVDLLTENYYLRFTKR